MTHRLSQTTPIYSTEHNKNKYHTAKLVKTDAAFRRETAYFLL